MSKAAYKRRDAVLKIIVSEYIVTATPVASEAILRHHSLGVSPATIRNDMASLEDDGYITRPYTSSGGVPLDKGYRFYVENISGNTDLSGDEQKRIRRLLDTAVDEYDRILKIAAGVMSRLVGNAAIVTFPKSAECRYKHIELVSTQQYVVMLVLILSNAVLRRQTIKFGEPVDQGQLSEAAVKFNREYAGRTRSQIAAGKLVMTPLEKKISATIREVMAGEDAIEYESSYFEGLRLMLEQPEFVQRERMLGVLELMEAKGWLRNVIDWQVTEEGVKVIIGGENRESALHDLSLVFSQYGVPDQVQGAVGIIGPKRMDYSRAISTVNYISGLLSELVARVCRDDR
ncbi:MAG: heat-inducible transcriptional repressor HrcA [Chloroflexi bacterium]|jgi:heat-inducible transcriptional repressor|nr:heat-inducible transcriptional repressor HrcA [Chloroflexota bacterium]